LFDHLEKAAKESKQLTKLQNQEFLRNQMRNTARLPNRWRRPDIEGNDGYPMIKELTPSERKRVKNEQ